MKPRAGLKESGFTILSNRKLCKELRFLDMYFHVVVSVLNVSAQYDFGTARKTILGVNIPSAQNNRDLLNLVVIITIYAENSAGRNVKRV